MRNGALFLLVLLAVFLEACGPAGPRQARVSPLHLGEARPLPTVQRLRVVALVDERYRRTPGFDARVGQRLDELSDQLAARVGLRVDVGRVVPWQTDEAESLESMLQTLEVTDPFPEADLVFAFTAAPPPRRARVEHLVRARYGGRFVVVRSLTPWFPPRAVERLHEAEVLMLMHGVGTVFGALPVCEPAVMAERIDLREADPRAWRWNEMNLALIRAHATLDLRGDAQRVPHDIAERALKILATPDAGTRCAREALEQRRRVLTAVVEGDTEKLASATDAPKPAPTDSPPKADGDPRVAEGRAALKAGDAAGALSICQPIADDEPAVAARCAADAASALGRHGDAAALLRAHLAHHPDDAAATLDLAREVGRAGDDAAARALLERFVETHPEHLRARINLGIAYARMGRFEPARAQWEAVLRVDPDNEDARQLLSRLPQQ